MRGEEQMNLESIPEAKMAIERYDQNEADALSNVPLQLSRCFIPTTFHENNWPTRVTNPNALWQYFDSMQWFRTALYVVKILTNRISDSELSMLDEIATRYGKLYEKFNRRTNPVGLNGMLSSIPTLRIINSLENDLGRKIKVLEIGGGSGLLGHMCHWSGHTHTNFDITQSFCIHNITVGKSLYGKEFFDASEMPYTADGDYLLNNQKSMNLIPWWHFVNCEVKLPEFDVVVMNHCFFEISKKALRFILSRISDASDERMRLIVSEWGFEEGTAINQEERLSLQERFDFQVEEFKGHQDINPRGTVLFSFKRKETFQKDYFNVAMDDRLDYGIDKPALFNSNPNPISLNSNPVIRLLKRFIPKIMKKYIKNLVYGKEDVAKSIIGSTIPKINPVDYPYGDYTNGWSEIKGLVSALEEKFGKPIYTEDEMAGFYINSKDHGG